jgi:hypothetical protein
MFLRVTLMPDLRPHETRYRCAPHKLLRSIGKLNRTCSRNWKRHHRWSRSSCYWHVPMRE